MIRWKLKFPGRGAFTDGPTMSQIRRCPGVVTVDGRVETPRGTFEFEGAEHPPAGTQMELILHFRNKMLTARSLDEIRKYQEWSAAYDADRAARRPDRSVEEAQSRMTVADRIMAQLGAVAGVWHLQSSWGYKVHAIFDEPFIRGRFKRAAAGAALCSGKVEDDFRSQIHGAGTNMCLRICPACRRIAEHLRNPVKLAQKNVSEKVNSPTAENRTSGTAGGNICHAPNSLANLHHGHRPDEVKE